MTPSETLDLQKKLLAYYEEHMEALKGSDDIAEARRYLFHYQIAIGVCSCALEVFAINVYGQDWIEENCTAKSKYWDDAPYECDNIPDILAALQTRITILKSLISK